MLFGNMHSEFTIIAATQRLCAHAKSLGSPCQGSVLPAAYRAALAHSLSHHRPRRPPLADLSQDAILYVAVVIVFYTAIILLLIGTNIRRRSIRKKNQPLQVAVYNQIRGDVQTKLAPSKASIMNGVTEV